MATPDGNSSAKETLPARAFLGGALVLALLLMVLLYLIWGFRWPPTAETVRDDTSVEYPEPSPLAEDED